MGYVILRFFRQIEYRMSAHFFLHRSIHRILFRKFNPKCTSSESSNFHPLFCPCHSTFRPTLDYISMFLSVETFIMIKYSYLPYLMSVTSAIVVHNSSKYLSTPNDPFNCTAWNNFQSSAHYSTLILYVFVVCMCNTCYDVK